MADKVEGWTDGIESEKTDSEVVLSSVGRCVSEAEVEASQQRLAYQLGLTLEEVQRTSMRKFHEPGPGVRWEEWDTQGVVLHE